MTTHRPAGAGRFRTATWRGLVCAATYAAAANILTFVLPAISGPSGGSTAGQVAVQAAVTLVGALAATGTALVLLLAGRLPVPGLAALCEAGVDACGLLGLGAAAAALAVLNRQPMLLACATLAVVAALAAGKRVSEQGTPSVATFADAGAAALMLVVSPYLASHELFGWGRSGAGAAGLATAAVIGIGYWRYRNSPASRSVHLLSPVLLTVVVIAGLSGSAVLRAGQGSSRPVPVVRSGAKSRPNVVLVVMDTVGAAHTSLHGYARDTTPALRSEWRSGATVYTRAIATSDWTLPSTASIFTGLLPTRHRAIASGPRLHTAISPEARTLPEYLRAAGYGTYGIVANHGYLDPRFGFGRGFDYYSSRRAAAAFGVKPYLLAAAVWRLLPPGWRKENRTAASITGEASRLLGDIRRTGTEPCFLFLNYMDAHIPYMPPDAYRRRFGPARPWFSWTRYQAMESAVLSGDRAVRPDEQQALEADYDAGIAFIDDHLGRLFGDLRRLGFLDNSLVIVTSDHGEMFGSSGVVGHGAGLFTDLVHVPLLVKYPGQREPVTVREVVSLADLLPTVLETVGLASEAPLDGRSLVGGGGGPERVAIAESFQLDWLAAQHRRFAGSERAAFTGLAVYRTLRDGSATSAYWGENGEAPGGWSPPARGDLIAELRRLAEESARLPVAPVADPELSETLRSLGYLGR